MAEAAAHLDVEVVERYLTKHLDGFQGPIRAEKFSAGQSNPTFLISAASGKYVLRRKPPGILLKSAHAVDREFRVQSALADSGIPVAKMRLLCEDDRIIGSVFYLMDYCEGRIFFDPSLNGISHGERGAVFDEMNRVLSALHEVDIRAVGLSDFGPTGNYYERQIGRWTKQYRNSETETLAAMDALIGAVTAAMPQDDGQRTLVHGDYRIDNMIFDKKNPKCLAILDWELSTTGHPYADLAAMIMQWQMPPGPVSRGLFGVDRKSHGLPSDQEFIDTYCKRRDLSGIPDFGFYLAFCFFRMAAILQGVKRRALDGNASNPEHGLKMGEHIPLFAAKGLDALGRIDGYG